MSLMASRISVLINAKPAYKNDTRKNFMVAGLLPTIASLGDVKTKKRMRTVHAVKMDMTMLPIKSFLLNEVE